ncbi:MAG: 5-(carboxyamino)imidazole ribonucleotide synthase [Bowdeniella nasicola]|nr:5-(carboxyamino)imidazole ribonucleotide synthase [Bowdeniella nasicola]
MKSYDVAVIGGGQLARMLHEAASALDIHLRALVASEGDPVAQVMTDCGVGSPDSAEAVAALVQGMDVLTFEHEHQDLALLTQLVEDGYNVHPTPQALQCAKDKHIMREMLAELDVPMPDWRSIRRESDLDIFLSEHRGECIVKTARGGYDGKGVREVNHLDDVRDWLEAMEAGEVELIAEELVPYAYEVAALCARRPSGEIRHWPLAETVQDGGVCAKVITPVPGADPSLGAQAERIAETIAEGLGVTGVLAVEMFVLPGKDGPSLLVNELAMRPHNSGHWTIEGSVTSQFEQHLRAVLNLPLGDTTARAPHAVMVNVLGTELNDPSQGYAHLMQEYPDAKVHLYGKKVRPRRKLGHVTVLGEDLEEVTATAEAAAAILRGDQPDWTEN